MSMDGPYIAWSQGGRCEYVHGWGVYRNEPGMAVQIGNTHNLSSPNAFVGDPVVVQSMGSRQKHSGMTEFDCLFLSVFRFQLVNQAGFPSLTTNQGTPVHFHNLRISILTTNKLIDDVTGNNK